MQCPNKSYAIVEQRADMGGTWDLFRYPGIRSDSDMHTLGYRFKPWLHEKTIADGPSIHEYVQETAEEYGISPHIHFGHKVISANWSSPDARWHVTAKAVDGGAERHSCSCALAIMIMIKAISLILRAKPTLADR
jgi:cation diffusion facilitator CzcD-associated flavoprotein CzcO